MSRSVDALRVAFSCAVAACLLPGTSLASDDVDEAAARALFAEGRKLAASGDYAAACPKFEESFRMDPGIGTSFNLADCWEHLGRTASAWGRFLGVAAAAKAGGQSDRERVARDRAAALESGLSRLIVTVTSPEPGLVVKRDTILVGPASWGVSVPVDPGPHTIQATAPQKKAFSVVVTVGPSGDAVTVAIAPLEAEAEAKAVAAPAPSESPRVTVALAAPPPPAPPQRSPVPSVVAGSLGVAALATAAIFGLEFRSDNGAAKKLCPTTVCSPSEKAEHDELVSEARRDRNFVYVGVAVGGVALATAALLWWRPAWLKRHAGSPHAGLTLRLSEQGFGAAIETGW